METRGKKYEGEARRVKMVDQPESRSKPSSILGNPASFGSEAVQSRRAIAARVLCSSHSCTTVSCGLVCRIIVHFLTDPVRRRAVIPKSSGPAFRKCKGEINTLFNLGFHLCFAAATQRLQSLIRLVILPVGGRRLTRRTEIHHVQVTEPCSA